MLKRQAQTLMVKREEVVSVEAAIRGPWRNSGHREEDSEKGTSVGFIRVCVTPEPWV